MSGYKVKSSLKMALGAEINRKKAEDKDKGATAAAASEELGWARRSKKIPVPAKTNKGVKSRVAKDLRACMTAEELATSHRRKAMLEKKAALYDQLKRGDSAGLSEAQRSSLGVDFEKKLEQEWDALQNGTQGEESEEGESDSSQESDDEQPDSNKDRVEVLDDMGRTRYVKPSRAHKYRRADAPETSTSQHQPDHPEDAPDYTQAIYGDQTEFPIYEQTEEERRARQAAMSELEAPLFKHYDPTSEVRDAGAARYRFSGDEEERKRQQEAIRTGKASGMADGYQVDAARRAKEEAEQKELRERREEIAQRKRKLQAAKEERAKKTAKNES